MTDAHGALSPFGVKTQGLVAQDLPPEALHLLQQRGTEVHYRRGQTVLRRAELPEHIF